MPHDKNNSVLQVGDEVIIRAKITNLTEGEEFCNITVQTIEGRRPDGCKETFTFNTGVVEKVEASLALEDDAA